MISRAPKSHLFSRSWSHNTTHHHAQNPIVSEQLSWNLQSSSSTKSRRHEHQTCNREFQQSGSLVSLFQPRRQLLRRRSRYRILQFVLRFSSDLLLADSFSVFNSEPCQLRVSRGNIQYPTTYTLPNEGRFQRWDWCSTNAWES